MTDLLQQFTLTQVCLVCICVIFGIKEAIEAYEFFKKRIDHQYDKKQDAIDHQAEIMEKLDQIDSRLTAQGVQIEKLENKLHTCQDALVEDLHDRINQKCRYYMNVLHGIPEDEFESFHRLCDAYGRNDGNHGLAKKVEYCVNNLPIIPIEKH